MTPRKIRWAFALLLSLAAGLATAAEPLRVATYNLRLNTPDDGANVWAARKDMVQALVRHHGFDLWGTQEGLPEQIADLAQMREYAHVGVGRDDGRDEGEHSTIFFRRSRFALLATGDFWLSETPDKPSVGWDGRCCNRLATWARLRDKATGRRLLVLSAHFDHEGRVAQHESALLILRWLKAHRGSDLVIALGDFNATPDTPGVQAMRAAYRDARLASETPPYGPEATFNDFRFGTAPQKLIDYVFVDPRIRVLGYAVLTDSDGVRYPSDHFPVLVRLQLPR
jgi:endonuclease/exonuclease/phosphatase family metal-dependent hydrolase